MLSQRLERFAVPQPSPRLTKLARQARADGATSLRPSIGRPKSISPRQQAGNVRPASRGSDAASAERSLSSRKPDSPSARTVTGSGASAPSSILKRLSHSARMPGRSSITGRPLPRTSRKMPRRPDRGSIRQRPSVCALPGCAAKRGEQRLELGELQRLLAAAHRGDEARERAKRDLLRRGCERRSVDQRVARLARLAVRREETLRRGSSASRARRKRRAESASASGVSPSTPSASLLPLTRARSKRRSRLLGSQTKPMPALRAWR